MRALKNLMLPIAMVVGAVFYKWMGYLTPLSPILILGMLFITYCKLNPRDIRPHRFQVELLIVQMALAGLVYAALAGFNDVVATGVFICVYIPTATAAPVITNMLGGSIPLVATYSLACNLFVAVTAPVILAAIGEHPELTFFESFLIICQRVFPLIVGPIVAAFLLRKWLPKVHRVISEHQSISFYMWAVSLTIVVGSSVSFVILNYSAEKAAVMIWLAAGALAVCLLQFYVGRRVGGRFGDKVTGGQSLGQKNTVLAIWLALAYLDPIASIAPASYVAWQNIINSWQLMHHKRKQVDLEKSS